MVKRSREDSNSSSPPTSTPTVATSPIREADEKPSKYAQLDDESTGHDRAAMMLCSLPPHRQALPFPTYDAFEVHYAQAHVNRCSACGRNFPTEHFLALHIEENHDPLNEARKARGEKIYGCFVDDCDRKCSTPQKRRRHLIDKHMFPKDYDIYVVNDGIDKRTSMLRVCGHRRRSSAAFQSVQREQRARRTSSAKDVSQRQGQSTSQEVPLDGETGRKRHAASETTDSLQDLAEESHRQKSANLSLTAPDDSSDDDDSDNDMNGPIKDKADADITNLTHSMSALKFVPPSVRLGKGGRNG